jgi:hypothetical protein
VAQRLIDRGVAPKRAEAVGAKVRRRYERAGNMRYLRYLAGVEDPSLLGFSDRAERRPVS